MLPIVSAGQTSHHAHIKTEDWIAYLGWDVGAWYIRIEQWRGWKTATGPIYYEEVPWEGEGAWGQGSRNKAAAKLMTALEQRGLIPVSVRPASLAQG